MAFKIVRNDITKMNTQAIVNTANAHPVVGAGCDSAVYKAAGYEKLLDYRKEKIGFVPEGDVFITPGFDLKAQFIIHAVSPLYKGGANNEEEKLRSCYRKALKLAKENSITSVSFPLIATGSFGYPKEEGMRIAVDEINAFLLSNEMEIFLVVFNDSTTSLGSKIYPDLEEYIDRNYVEEKLIEEYGYNFSGQERRSRFDETGRLIGGQDPAGMIQQSANAWRDDQCYTAPSYMNAAPKPESKKSSKLSIFKKRKKDDSAEQTDKKVMAPSAPVASSAFIDFETEHESKLDERIRHLSDTFSQYLLYLIQNKQMENAEVYKRAIVDKKIFSKIKNNINYHPQKLTALCLCVGAKLNLDESRDLLARAGYALSPCDKTDIIFSYFIENEIYDMIELDIQLEEHGLPCIIS